jgi:hypothetical protein
MISFYLLTPRIVNWKCFLVGLKVTGYKPEELIKLNSLGREMVFAEDLPEIKKNCTSWKPEKFPV